MIKIKNIKITNVGGSKGIIIPYDFIEHGDLDITKEYDVTFDEKEKKEE